MPARVLIDGERAWRWVPYFSEEIATGGRSRWRVGLQRDAPEGSQGWLQAGDDPPMYVALSTPIGRFPDSPAAVLYFATRADPQGRKPPEDAHLWSERDRPPVTATIPRSR